MSIQTDISKLLLTFDQSRRKYIFYFVVNASFQPVGVVDGQTIKLRMVDINKINVTYENV